MSRPRHAIPPALLAALAPLAACSGPAAPPPPPAPTVRLSSETPDANAPAVAAFIRRTCLDAGAEPAALAEALHGSGWSFEQLPAAGAETPISLWRLDHGELIHSLVQLEPGASFIDCRVELDGAVAPSIETVRDALRPLVRERSLRELSGDPPERRWQWEPSAGEEWQLTIRPTAARPGAAVAPARRGITIHTAITRTPPRPPAAIE